MKQRIKLLALAGMSGIGAISTQAQEAATWHAKTLGEAVGFSAVFGLVAIVMLLLGFKIFDKAVTHIDLEKEIQKGNIAAAILSAAVLIALAILLAAAIS